MSFVIGHRDQQIDGLKFILMFLVILGHMSYDSFGLPINKAIYTFHMPLFVCISGYFTHKSPDKTFLAWTVRTIGIFLIFETFHILLNVFWLNKPFTFYNYIHPDLALWYLLSLVLWRAIHVVLDKLGIGPSWSLFGFSLFCGIVAGFVPIGHTLSFQRTFAFYPFFVLGQIIKEHKQIIQSHPNYLIELTIIICALFVGVLLPQYMPKEPYHQYTDAFVRCAQTAVALVLCISILRLSRILRLRYFGNLGQYTLFFYLYHTLFIRVQESILAYNHTYINIFHALLITTLYIIIIRCMVYVKPFRWLLLKP